MKEEETVKEMNYNCNRPSWISQLGIEEKKKKGIDGRAPPGVEPAQLNLTQHGKTQQVQT